jgi:hypothetical protein
MPGSLSEFRKLPVSVQKAFISLAIGWLVHLVIVFLLFQDDQKIVLQNLAIGVFVFVFVVIKQKNWARTLCLISNLLLVLFYIFTTLLMLQGRVEIAGLAGVNTGVFLVASWFLLKKETVGHFKSLMQTERNEKQ